MTVQTLKPGLRHLKGPVHQIHRSTSEAGGLGDEHAHASTAAVAQDPCRIETLHRGASGHQQLSSAPVLRQPPLLVRQDECAFHRQLDQPGRHHASITDPVTGEQTSLRAKTQHPFIVCQQGPVPQHRRMPPHGCIHGGGSNDGTFTGQQQTGEKTIGETLRPARQRAGTERRDDHQFSPLSQCDMERAWLTGVPLVPVLVTAMATEAGQRHRTDELGGTGRDHTTHLSTGLDQGAHEQRRLDGGDAATRRNEDPTPLEHHRLSLHRRVPDRSDARRGA